MSGYSKVGTSGVYEAGDQRNVRNGDDQAPRYEQGNTNAHDPNDSKDQRTIANRLAAEEQRNESQDDRETQLLKKDPTLPAKMHGNEPSKGAKIDAEIQAEEEAELARKGR